MCNRSARRPRSAKHGEIAPRLRRLDHAERVAVARDLQVDDVVAGDLQEDAGVGTALVGLPGGVQEPRPEPDTGRRAGAVAHHRANLAQRLLVLRRALDVGEQGDVVALVHAAEVGGQECVERGVNSERVGVALVRERGQTRLLQDRLLRRERAGLLVLRR